MERILLLVRAHDYPMAQPCLEEAHRLAASPQTLSFGLSLEEVPSAEQLQALQSFEGTLIGPDMDLWHHFSSCWQGESLVLVTSPDTVFSRDWDRRLTEELRRAGEKCVLTGILPWPGDVVDAVRAVCAESLSRDLVLSLGAGIPLRYARRSHASAFVNPEFAFASSAFFQMAEKSRLPLFLAAFDARFRPVTLRAPVLRRESRTVLPRIPLRPVLEEVKGFASHFGMNMDTLSLSPALREGIFTKDLQVDMEVPLTVRAQEALRRGLLSRHEQDPLCVTAAIEREGEAWPDPLAMARFRRLASLERMSLLCYASPSLLRGILYSHPNTLALKPQEMLSVASAREKPENRSACEVLNRFFLLSRAREKSMDHSHYIWLDLDYLRYPVYSGAMLHWDAVCTDRVCIGKVRGHLDFSMISVPDDMVNTLCREIRALCEKEVRKSGDLPDVQQVMEQLAGSNPGRFDFPEMPDERELLSMTMTLSGEEWGTR